MNVNESPYATNNNNPVLSKDPTGADPEKPTKNGNSEGESQTTSETTYGLHQISKTTTQTWNWHAGSSEYKTKAGWYTPEEYINVLRPIGKELAQYEGLYSAAAQSFNPNWTEAEKADVANTRLGRFIGTGLSDNAAQYLGAAAKNYASHRNFMASGYTEPSGFNVEDMLGVGLLLKGTIKYVGNKVANTINVKLLSYARDLYGISGSKNVGILAGELESSMYYRVASSGKYAHPGTSSTPVLRVFRTFSTGKNSRLFDSEVLLMEEFAAQFHKTPNIKGTLTLTSELPFCPSCAGVIPQFKKMFPNINLLLSNGVK